MSDGITVHASWDDEAKVFVVTSSDIDGLALEVGAFEDLAARIIPAIEDLFVENGNPFEAAEVPVRIIAIQNGSVLSPAAS